MTISALARPRPWVFIGFVGWLGLVYRDALASWVALARSDDLHSHVLLIPVISAVLVWQRRGDLNSECRASPAFLAVALAGAGVSALAASYTVTSRVDYVAAMVFSFTCGVIFAVACVFGRRVVSTLRLPLAFLFFMVPLPGLFVDSLEYFLQLASAEAFHWLLKASGTVHFREGTAFLLPTIGILTVAPECSGIRSTWVLLITSVLSGALFLRDSRSRMVLALLAVPIGIVRNGLRIFTIAMMCVHVNPEMIHSPLHSQGGPPFFLISLIPLFGAAWLLGRLERRGQVDTQA